MIFLVLSGKIIFLFPENMIWHLRQKMKDDLSQKNTRKYDILFKLSENMVFSKSVAPAHDLSCIIWKDDIFFPKTWSFFPGQKVKDGLSREIHGNMMHRLAKKKQETWYIGSKFGLSLNLFGWKYSTMNNLQYFVPFSPQGLCLRACLSANGGNHLSIRG